MRIELCVGRFERHIAPSSTFVYVDDLDAHYQRAGATIITDHADHGPNRIYIACDCGGHQWMFATPLG